MSHQNLPLRRRTILKTLGISAVSGTMLSGVASAKGNGKTTGKSNQIVTDGDSIQAAIDDADPGDSILIEDGTYREQVSINKDLELQGETGATIEAPTEMDPVSIPESAGTTWEPIVFAYGGDEDDGSVSGGETVDVSISGITVDGRGTQPTARRKVGIFYRNVKGNGRTTIANTEVIDMGVGGKETMGILAYGDSDLVITDNEVVGFERGGIGANGNGGAHPSPHVSIQDNRVDSDSPRGGWGPNGIQVGYGATGAVRDNSIVNCRWADGIDDAWTASGVLVFESDALHISGNTVANCDVGVGVETWSWFQPSASANLIQRNEINDVLVGAELSAVSWDGFSQSDPEAINNKIVNNEIVNEDENPGAIGVAISTSDASEAFDPDVDNNKVVKNTIEGFDEQLLDTGEASKIAAIRP